MGCWGGVMYILIGRDVAYENQLKQAMVFGGLVFGMNWVIFNLFALLFIKVSVLDLLYRSIVDSLAIMIGVYISSFFSARKAGNAIGHEVKDNSLMEVRGGIKPKSCLTNACSQSPTDPAPGDACVIHPTM